MAKNYTHIIEVKGSKAYLRRGNYMPVIRDLTIRYENPMSVTGYSTHCFVDLRYYSVPVGFVERVIQLLKAHFDRPIIKVKYPGYKRDLGSIDENILSDTRSPKNNLEWEPLKLWPFQVTAINKLLHHKTGIFWGATSSGKTIMFSALTKHLAQFGLKTLVITPSKSLLNQTKEKLQTYLQDDIGQIGDSKQEIRHVTVATEQTLQQALQGKRNPLNRYLRNDVDVLIIDEVHRSAADVWYEVALKCRATYRFGFTASLSTVTPLSVWKLEGICGKVRHRIKSSDLHKMGFRSSAYVYCIRDKRVFGKPYVRISQGQQTANMYHALHAETYVNNEKLRKEVIRLCQLIGKYGFPTLILCGNNSEFPKSLSDSLTEAGLRSKWLTGKSPSGVRDSVKKELETGDTQFLSTTTIFDEGTDIPAVKILLLLSGGKSGIKSEQRTGRVLRLDGVSDKVFIVDFQSMQHRWLENHALERTRAYRREDLGYNVQVTNKFPEFLETLEKELEQEQKLYV